MECVERSSSQNYSDSIAWKICWEKLYSCAWLMEQSIIIWLKLNLHYSLLRKQCTTNPESTSGFCKIYKLPLTFFFLSVANPL